MHTVLVYRRSLLAYSETFIRAQILAYRTWRGILVGGRRIGELGLDGLETRVLEARGVPFAHRALDIRLRLGIPPNISMLRRENPALVHAHFGMDGVDAAPIARALKVPLLITLHGYDINIAKEWWERGHGGQTRRDYPRRLLRLAERPDVHFVAVSDGIRRRAMEWGIAGEKITTCFIGIDTKQFSPGPTPVQNRDRRVLFVGRLIENKGCEYLIRAFGKVLRTIPDAQLIVVGDGPLKCTLAQLVDDIGIGASVHFRGRLLNSEVKLELDKARVFCQPSVRIANGNFEGLGIVSLEAQACGVPVVTSANGSSIENILDGITGYAFRQRDVDDLAAKLTVLLSDGKIASAMSEEAPRFMAAKFDIQNCTQKLELLYDEWRNSVGRVPDGSQRMPQ